MRSLGCLIAGALALITLIGASIWLEYATVDYEYVTVHREPQRECHTSVSSDSNGNTSSSTSCHWKVYTDGEVFKLTDSLLFWQFNSADIANELRPGRSYCLKVNGWRVGWLSMFRKVIRIESDTFQCGVPR